MFEKFTDRARKVLRLADTAAKDRGDRIVGTEHLLLGVAADWAGVGAMALKNMGITATAMKAATNDLLGEASRPFVFATNLPMTERSETVVRLATEASAKLGHQYVGTEHLVIGLRREGSGVAARVLKDFGVEVKAFEAEVVALLNGNVDNVNFIGAAIANAADLAKAGAGAAAIASAIWEPLAGWPGPMISRTDESGTTWIPADTNGHAIVALKNVLAAKEKLSLAKSDEEAASVLIDNARAAYQKSADAKRLALEEYHAARGKLEATIAVYPSAVQADPA